MVAVTGLGIISSIGLNLEENITNLLSYNSGLGFLKNFNSSLPFNPIVGEVKLSNQELKDEIKIKKSISRTSLLAIKALKEALNIADIKLSDNKPTSFISGTTVGSMDFYEKYWSNHLTANNFNRSELSKFAGTQTYELADYFEFNDYITTICTACTSGANAILLGCKLIEQNIYERVIVGGTDALANFTLNGFHSLMIYATEKCTPFDCNRTGLNLGEGAAYLVLEPLSRCNNKASFALISGWANSNDAFHSTASSDNGHGGVLAMNIALNKAKLKPFEIDYINCHGTATLNNDLSELNALRYIFENRIPAYSSTKAYTGHTLAAAGAIEAVFSILALKQQSILPNLYFNTPMDKTVNIPELYVKPASLKNILSNSFGFGGNCTSLIFTNPS